jgi:hypothetical protein
VYLKPDGSAAASVYSSQRSATARGRRTASRASVTSRLVGTVAHAVSTSVAGPMVRHGANVPSSAHRPCASPSVHVFLLSRSILASFSTRSGMAP